MKTVFVGLFLALTIACFASSVVAAQMRKIVPSIPPDAQIVDRQWRGAVEVITYEHQGKRYQEERVYSQRPLTAKGKSAIAILKEKAGLNDDQAFQVVLLLQENDWQRLRHLETKWPASAVEKVRKQTVAQVKKGIAAVVGSDPAALEKVLRLDLGFEIPPMKDFVVRDAKEEPAR